MRVHSNFAEYAPLTILLIFMLEVQGARPLLVHALCICLLLGRIVHAYGVSQTPENLKYRVTGMILTFTALVSASTSLLVSLGPRVWGDV